MNRRSKSAMLVGVLLMASLGTLPALAKRRPPPEVKEAVKDGVRYLAPHFVVEQGKPQTGGYVQARRVGSNQLLWQRLVYHVIYDDRLERDVQDVFIARLHVRSGALAVENELGETFEVSLDGGTCRAIVKRSKHTVVAGGEGQ